MKHLFKIALLILPVTLLSSCGGVKNYPYEVKQSNLRNL